MARHNVNTFANGFGQWHAEVKNRRPDLRFASGINSHAAMTDEIKKYRVAAYRAIRKELSERGESTETLRLEVCGIHEDYGNDVGYPLTYCFREV